MDLKEFAELLDEVIRTIQFPELLDEVTWTLRWSFRRFQVFLLRFLWSFRKL